MSCLKGGNCEHGGCSDCQDESNIKLGQDWLIKEGTKKMSIENIKTGLKLSEAIKLIEENEGALLKLENTVSHMGDFRTLDAAILIIGRTYSVKLPPPKTVTVTRAGIEKAAKNTIRKNLSTYNSFDIEHFCKELGL